MRKNQLEPGQRLEIKRMIEDQDEASVFSASSSQTMPPSCEAMSNLAGWLVSQLLDEPADGKLMIAAPIDAFRVVDWPVGSRVEITYVEPLRGIWHLRGQLMDRGISDRIVYYMVRQEGKAKRLQRRTHFRIDCTLEVRWQLARNKNSPSTETEECDLQSRSQDVPTAKNAAGTSQTQTNTGADADFAVPAQTAYTHDISGGGLQLISDSPVPVDSILNLQLQIGGKVLKTKGRIIRCSAEKAGREKQYRISIQFIKLQHADQEDLIQTIFELQNQRLGRQQS